MINYLLGRDRPDRLATIDSKLQQARVAHEHAVGAGELAQRDTDKVIAEFYLLEGLLNGDQRARPSPRAVPRVRP